MNRSQPNSYDPAYDPDYKGGDGPDVAWICFDCGDINPIEDKQCQDCGKDKP